MAELTHLDNKGKVKMVDVGNKEPTPRRASAVCTMIMQEETLDLISSGQIAKGDVFATAKIAGIMAAKKTPDLIPLCHQLNLANVNIEFEIESRPPQAKLIIHSEVKLEGKTGAEMEALTACSVAALTVYDMTKAVEKGIRITDLRLLEKEGGKSAKWQAK